jgi:AcrR family transcriptional regulator
MDPRQQRTHAALRSAIYEMASRAPISTVSVADVAKRAGISRQTFYRWAEAPEALLAAMLNEELDELVAANSRLPRTAVDDLSVFDRLAHEILRLVARHARVYQNAMNPRLSSLLRDGLASRIEASLRSRLSLYPEIAPDVLGKRPSAVSREMFIAYAGVGAVGAIEVWLESGDLTDIDTAAATIPAAAAAWWLGLDSLAAS